MGNNMLRVDNYSRLPSVTSAYRDQPESYGADISRPVLLPPGTTRPVLATPLSEESQLKRQAYTGYFIQHLMRFTMSSVSFGLSLAATVLSGGTGLPLAVMTGTAMIIAAGDACCALYNLIQVRNDREPLNTGNDSIVVATKMLMTTCGMTDSHAEIAGDVASCAFRIGIALSFLFLPSAQLPGSTAHTLSSLSSGITAALTIAGGGTDMYTARVERMRRSIAVSASSATVEADEESDKTGQEKRMVDVDSEVACNKRYWSQLNALMVSPAW